VDNVNGSLDFSYPYRDRGFDSLYDKSNPDTMVFQSQDELKQKFGDIKELENVDFSKQMVIFLQKEDSSSRPLNMHVNKIISDENGFTIDWSLQETPQGIAPPPEYLQQCAGFVIVDRADGESQFNYQGVTRREGAYMVPGMNVPSAPPPGVLR